MFLLNILSGIFLIIIGVFIGYNFKEWDTKINKLIEDHKKEPVEVGPTPGLYHRANENAPLNNIEKKTGAVMPKTPQLLEWEEQERVRKMNGASV